MLICVPTILSLVSHCLALTGVTSGDHNNMGNKDIIIQILVLILNIDTTDTPDNIDNTDTTTNNEYWSNYTNIHNANNCYL